MKRSFPTDAPSLAKLLIDKGGVSVSYASELANGVKTPSYAIAERLEASCGVPMRHWAERKASRERSEAA